MVALKWQVIVLSEKSQICQLSQLDLHRVGRITKCVCVCGRGIVSTCNYTTYKYCNTCTLYITSENTCWLSTLLKMNKNKTTRICKDMIVVFPLPTHPPTPPTHPTPSPAELLGPWIILAILLENEEKLRRTERRLSNCMCVQWNGIGYLGKVRVSVIRAPMTALITGAPSLTQSWLH